MPHRRSLILHARRRLWAAARPVLVVAGVLSPALHAALVGARAQGAAGLDAFNGSVSVTSKGISTIPNLTLGKPAVIFSATAEKKGVSFAPEFRASLEGQPWAFLFRWRYDLARRERFRLNVGVGPSVSFKPVQVAEAPGGREILEARRFLAGEISASRRLAGGLSAGVYHLYSYGFEASTPTHTNYLSAGIGLPGVGLGGGLVVGFRPQLYYLNLDGSDGIYATLHTTLSKGGVPMTLASLVNTPVQSSVAGDLGFLWNVSLVYSFNFVD